MIVEIKIDESEHMTMFTYFEDYDVEIKSELPIKEISAEKVKPILANAKRNLELAQRVAEHDPELANLVEEIRKDHVLEKIERLLAQGSKEHPEPWDSAEDRVLELQAMLDPHLTKVDELLSWPPHKEWCDENVNTARDIVAETYGLTSAWKQEFERLCEEYDEACRRLDKERTLEIAFIEIPAHFKEDEQLRERTSGQGSLQATAERTIRISGRDSTIKQG